MFRLTNGTAQIRQSGSTKTTLTTTVMLPKRRYDFRVLAAFLYCDLRSSRPGVPDPNSLASSLGVSTESLSRLGVGWFDPQHQHCWPDSAGVASCLPV